MYVNAYIPGFLGGTDSFRPPSSLRKASGRVNHPSLHENSSHSILFTDTYTQTGVMVTQKVNDQWTVQGALHAGTDMAPWYKGSLLSERVAFGGSHCRIITMRYTPG